jgi:Icc-related predicted phosphoesterase
MKTKYIITVISDTHGKHIQITDDLPGGDILICSGDISSMGYEHEIREFCSWFDKLNSYNHKIFIAGNHDWGFQDIPETSKEIVDLYKNINYLQDELICIAKNEDAFDYESMIKIYGSPWQPEFHNWAFNLPRNSPEMWEKMLEMPLDTDILVTHGPAFGILDTTEWDRSKNLGCEMLTERIAQIKPKIHVCGHIHSGYGYKFDGTTHFFNAAVLGERYTYQNKPFSFEWDKDTNEINFL